MNSLTAFSPARCQKGLDKKKDENSCSSMLFFPLKLVWIRSISSLRTTPWWSASFDGNEIFFNNWNIVGRSRAIDIKSSSIFDLTQFLATFLNPGVLNNWDCVVDARATCEMTERISTTSMTFSWDVIVDNLNLFPTITIFDGYYTKCNWMTKTFSNQQKNCRRFVFKFNQQKTVENLAHVIARTIDFSDWITTSTTVHKLFK